MLSKYDELYECLSIKFYQLIGYYKIIILGINLWLMKRNEETLLYFNKAFIIDSNCYKIKMVIQVIYLL